MVRTASSLGPGFELKHRIVGAVILITFAVVVLPVILGGPKPSERDSPTAAQGKDASGNNADTQVFVSKITPIGGATPEPLETPPDRGSGEEPSSPPSGPPASGQSAGDGERHAEASPPEPVAARAAPPAAAQPPAEDRAEAAELDRGWIVRVGTYSQKENAERVMEGLEELGFEASSGSVKTRNGVATRVWVGPFAQRVEAARARTRIERATGQKGLIAAFP